MSEYKRNKNETHMNKETSKPLPIHTEKETTKNTLCIPEEKMTKSKNAQKKTREKRIRCVYTMLRKPKNVKQMMMA